MALTRAQKEEQLQELKAKMQAAKSVVFAHYIGLTVSDISALRSKLKQSKSEMKVAKKTLIRIAAKELQLPEVSDESMEGAVACIFSNDDPVAGASAAFAFGKDHDQVKLIGGFFEGKLLSKDEAVSFASLPNRQTLLGMFIMMCNTPLTQFANVINNPLTSFARATAELAKKKEESAAPAAAAADASTPTA